MKKEKEKSLSQLKKRLQNSIEKKITITLGEKAISTEIQNLTTIEVLALLEIQKHSYLNEINSKK